MSKEELEEYKRKHCSKCNKNIDCKIVRQTDGKLVCIEED